MKTRITLATVGVVLLALVLSGLFTLVLARRAAIDATRADLREQAVAISGEAGGLPPRALLLLRRVLRLESAEVVPVDRTGRPLRPLPPVVDESELVPGQVVVGNDGPLVWAVAPVSRPMPGARAGSLVVVTQRAGSGLGRAGLWFAAS